VETKESNELKKAFISLSMASDVPDIILLLMKTNEKPVRVGPCSERTLPLSKVDLLTVMDIFALRLIAVSVLLKTQR
jgi:hypothetical protein